MTHRLGKYELRRRLGEGTTAAVYLGFDPFAAREVAIKIIYPEALRDPALGRMYRHLLTNEASLAGKLHHPHIVEIYDAMVDEEQGYIVMEYVRGGTLERFAKPDRLLPIDRLVEIVFKCTRALDYACRLGITHRDIKPANVLLTTPDDTGGDIKITDFGAALMSTSDQTQVAHVGSPAYMSPEQVREHELNHQTDIYSLGVLMYQMLTGRLPFEATNNYSMIYQICNADPPPPSTLRADVPAGLDAITARAMHKELDKRYARWEEFSHDLAQAFRNHRLQSRVQVFSDSDKFETLRALPFFSEFSDVEIWEVVRFSDWAHVAPGTVVMKDGERGDFFCFLADGEVRVEKRGRRLNTLSAGDCFGEMAVIGPGGGGRQADVIAIGEARIVTIRGEALRRSSDACRMHFYAAFLRVLTNRLAIANSRLAAV
ncbi:MAG: serine/threonine-protein kinase [Rhodocyclaceae bacterium]